ncbi:DNA-formamidopyrimidine glycosylase family protein, partial [Robbsia andropogonis]|uniref:DNA-formamidopyrimidine glycosylase family protein n=1 Tax=Robbsia andropogonis TaxID=28092 RepID=UPI00344CA5CB
MWVISPSASSGDGRRTSRRGILFSMPELPEVHALVADLRGRLIGREVARLEITAFAALKTFDPPVSAVQGRTVTGVERH